MIVQRLRRFLPSRRPVEMVKSFDHELKATGSLISQRDIGLQVVPIDRIVGSVGRSRELRRDFLFRHQRGLSERHHRIGRAMRAGKSLPPLHLYELLRSAGEQPHSDRPGEYYVVDGHHRVAMARRLGQVYFDAHVVQFRPVPPSQSR